ncbi:trypsin-like serine protease [Streptococcus sp. zg-86]|uniref:Serine protease n=1 Tax=Streptococcus zhangguiae TaxID=2664091 RepID=A0A6I4RAM7_9STRE|nr:MULTISPECIES: serine protease [unclassified Streptococcus]MTB64899.1 trypsin-like serine protease [Streptococcus sp. zg-86]MTB91031.1 trypsin-like serine protease [Streptococcus sp. zg-36]MWV56886.1 trypsin-like serine protease [Streptococcus sp. zg-70]QTH48313.1 trypsin-like peptidase domain-containing protein [Streptococcus sp. zg-86]
MKPNRFCQLALVGLLVSSSGLSLTGCSTSQTTAPSTQQAKTKETTKSHREQIKDIATSSYNGIALIQSIENAKGHGTGVFISPDTLLTNRHVVTGLAKADTAVVRTVDQQGKQVDLPIKEFIAPEDESMDIGIVKLQKPITSNKELSHLTIQKIASLDTTDKTKVSDFIRAVGYPGDKEHGTLWDSQGMIKEIDGNFLTYTAPIASGSSGSPLFNKNGDMIGIANASTDDLENPTSFGLLFDKSIRAFIAKHQ